MNGFWDLLSESRVCLHQDTWVAINPIFAWGVAGQPKPTMVWGTWSTALGQGTRVFRIQLLPLGTVAGPRSP